MSLQKAQNIRDVLVRAAIPFKEGDELNDPVPLENSTGEAENQGPEILAQETQPQSDGTEGGISKMIQPRISDFFPKQVGGGTRGVVQVNNDPPPLFQALP